MPVLACKQPAFGYSFKLDTLSVDFLNVSWKVTKQQNTTDAGLGLN